MTRIDKLLILASLLAMTLLSSCDSWDDHYEGDSHDTESLLSILQQTAEANEFVTLLQETELDKVIANDEVFTVFIPPLGAFDGLEGDVLKASLGNHIVFKRLYFSNLEDSMIVQAVSGKYLSIKRTDDVVYINSRDNLVEISGDIMDLEAMNGVVHSVNKRINVVPNIEEQISNLDPQEYSIFLEYFNKFDSIYPDKISYELGFNEDGSVVLAENPFWVYPSFNAADEENPYTLLVPNNNAILKQKEELLELNGGLESRISPKYYTRLIRNQMLQGAFSNSDLFNADTILTIGNDWVVGKKLSPSNYYNMQVASNGYLLESSDVIYKPIAADFIDSIVYEAEWCLGFENHTKSLIYTSDLEPQVSGNGVSINYHLFASSLLRNNTIQFFIPDVFKGLYQVKIAYQWSNISVSITSDDVPISTGSINLLTYIPRDINNVEQNKWAYGPVGNVFLAEDGNLNLSFNVTNGTYATMMIDKIVLIPLEY